MQTQSGRTVPLMLSEFPPSPTEKYDVFFTILIPWLEGLGDAKNHYSLVKLGSL